MKIEHIFVFFKVTLLLSLVATSSALAKVEIHSDNPFDIASLKELTYLGLSVEANAAILSVPNDQLLLTAIPFKRSMQFIDDGKPICVMNRTKTKARAQKYLFSKPVNLFISRRLYQSDDFPPLPNEPVDLVKLFKQYPDRRLIISTQLSYGDEIDDIIKKIPPNNLVVRTGGNQDTGVLQMFYKKRAEYALFNPQTFIDDTTMSQQGYELLNVAPFIIGHFMCSKTPETLEFITQINAKIDQLIAQDVLYNIHLKYINKNQKLSFDKYYNKIFKNVANKS